MEVSVAIIRLRPSPIGTESGFLAPNNYEVLVSSASDRKLSRSLLRCRTQRGEDSVEAAMRCIRRLNNSLPARAVPIPLCDSMPGTSSASQFRHQQQFQLQCSPLVCVPLLGKYPNVDKISIDDPTGTQRLQFCNLAKLVNESFNSDPTIDSQSRQMLIRIEEWLSEEQRRDILFINSLFAMPNPSMRIRICVHNPAYHPRLAYFCHSVLDKSGKPELQQKSSELEEAVKKSNTVRARMIEMEKYDKYQINPIFGVFTSYKRRLMAPEYYVKGRKAIRKRSPTQQRSPTEFWEQQFPLHKYAFDGDHEKIRDLLNQGYNPNELDNDFWTPLHYCAFYNRFEACQVLMTHSKTSVNAVNKTGHTALHFAALNGHYFLVELILSHQFVDTNIEDANGMTALDLCDKVPKPDWQDAAFLLRSCQLRPTKLEVQIIGGSALQVEVADIREATAGELRDSVLATEGMTQAAGRIFAIWISSKRLSLQLKAEQKVNVHLEKWPEHLEKWGDPPTGDPITSDEADQARIILRRDARTLLGDEQALVSYLR
ncbi:ankyrin repeats (3 copies) domain-containing protein [Ditylenchus destructor]|uniref:Ankyrin repeats (3 copies) domain-containing protein n=1 Tax=Ditylenchus destructor TaxID=166010 RepID=A0AAD4NBP3_9BILA|nr:ankyrin repeats (3 copies) domain-containing protein [Ditylenchus destructor]